MQKMNLLIKATTLFLAIEIALIILLLIAFSIISENCTEIEISTSHLFFEVSSGTGYHIDFSKYAIRILLFLGLIPSSIYLYKYWR